MLDEMRSEHCRAKIRGSEAAMGMFIYTQYDVHLGYGAKPTSRGDRIRR